MPVDRVSWDDTWLAVAHNVAMRSRCSRAQVGAVVVSSNQRICATGYNGPAASWPHEGECSEWCPRARGETALDNAYDSCPAIHAEANALLYVDRSQVEGGTVYVTGAVCMQCAKLVSNSGVARVVMVVRDSDAHRDPIETIKYLKKCKIDVLVVGENDNG